MSVMTGCPVAAVSVAEAGPVPGPGDGISLCSLRAVSKTYLSRKSHRMVLDAVDLDIGPGEILGLVGRSGAGKSTLARILAWMEPPDSGTVLYQGLEVLAGRAPRGLRRQVQYVFQNPAQSLNPRMRVGRQLLEGPLFHNLGSREELERRLAEILGLLGLDAADWNRYPHQFSGGQQQRLALARSLSVGPCLLICDEVTSALDRKPALELLALLERINRALGVAIVFISHDRDAVRQLCPRVLELSAGRLQPPAADSSH